MQFKRAKINIFLIRYVFFYDFGEKKKKTASDDVVFL